MNRHWSLLMCCVVAALMLLSGCRHNSDQGAVKIVRFERLLMEVADDALGDSLRAFAERYATPLLRVYPDDAQYMSMVAAYRADSVVRMVDDTVRHHLADLSWLEHDLYEAMARAYKLDTSIRCHTFITYISNAGYAQRVAADRESHTMTISIDEYVAPRMRQYGYFGEPLYIVRQCNPSHIVPDCMAELVRQYIVMPEGEPTLLDYIVLEGKVQYFLHKVLPRAADTLLLRYTADQMNWMEANESNVWAYFVQNKMLYSHDYSRLRNFIEDAPKTNAFQESAPRTIEFIGWHIVSSYVRESGRPFAEVLAETDAQTILYTSGYRP